MKTDRQKDFELKSKSGVIPKDIAASFVALKRAAKRAREIAKQTQTPLIIMQDGHLQRVWVKD